jgi:hypothetical protein
MEQHDNVGETSNFQKIADLKQALSSPVSPYGDWKGIKQREYKEAGYAAPYTDAEMQEYYEKRLAIRKQINELEQAGDE